jgi:uncharacterized protein YjbJ (UPF0337 family)
MLSAARGAPSDTAGRIFKGKPSGARAQAWASVGRAGTRIAEGFRAFTILSTRGTTMNKDQLEGVGKKVKGKVNELVGKATGNTTQQIKGELQQGAGEVQKQYGNVKEDLKKGRP